MNRSSLVVALSIGLLLPSLAAADLEPLHPAAPRLAPTPAALLPDQGRLDLLPAELRSPALLAHAQQRKVIGRSLTLAGIGALVVALGAGVPLLVNSKHSYGLGVAGSATASIFGSLAGSALTVGPILWQLGASEENRLRNGTFDMRLAVQRRRIAGALLIGIGVLGEIVAIVGGGLAASSATLDGPDYGAVRVSPTLDLGIDLALAGSALAVLGCTMGGTLWTTAARDQQLQLSLSLAPGGLRMIF